MCKQQIKERKWLWLTLLMVVIGIVGYVLMQFYPTLKPWLTLLGGIFIIFATVVSTMNHLRSVSKPTSLSISQQPKNVEDISEPTLQSSSDEDSAIPAFRTWIVDTFHRGDFATITEAINVARDGDKIMIRPGIYKEALVINKVLEIVGEGKCNEIVIEVSSANVIDFKVQLGKISNLTIRQTGGYYAVNITMGRLVLTQCDISAPNGFGIGVHGVTTLPHVHANHIHTCQSGIMVYDGGQGTIEENKITGNVCGLSIKTSNPIVRNNDIHDNVKAGIMVYERGNGTIEENRVFGNESHGIQVRTLANPIIRDNYIHKNKIGVSVYDNGRGKFESNWIYHNELGNWQISEDCEPHVRLQDNESFDLGEYPQPPVMIEISDSMSPAEKRGAKIANSKSISAYKKQLKAMDINPSIAEF